MKAMKINAKQSSDEVSKLQNKPAEAGAIELSEDELEQAAGGAPAYQAPSPQLNINVPRSGSTGVSTSSPTNFAIPR